jgi:MFS_1 like family
VSRGLSAWVPTAPTKPLLDAYALRGLALRGRAYGPVRLWGSVAFVFANFGAGFVIDRIAPIQIIWLLFGSLVVVAAVSLTLQPIAPDGGSAEKVDAAAGKLLLSPGFWVFTSGASLFQASHAVYYGFSVLDWRAKGLDTASIGGLWGLAVIAEIALFAVSARFPQRVGSLGLLGVGAFGAMLRWGVMSFNPPLVLLPAARVFVRRHPPWINAAPGPPCAGPAIRHSPGRLCHAAGASHGGRHGVLRCALCRPRRSRLCGDGARSGFGRRLRAVSAHLDNSTKEMIRHSHRSNACLPQKTCWNYQLTRTSFCRERSS